MNSREGKKTEVWDSRFALLAVCARHWDAKTGGWPTREMRESEGPDDNNWSGRIVEVASAYDTIAEQTTMVSGVSSPCSPSLPT